MHIHNPCEQNCIKMEPFHGEVGVLLNKSQNNKGAFLQPRERGNPRALAFRQWKQLHKRTLINTFELKPQHLAHA